MSTLGKAVIEFSADTAKFSGDVGRAEAVFSKSIAKMEAKLGDLQNLFIAAAGVGGIALMIKSAIDAADQLGKLSQKVGISVERLSELKLAAELGNVDLTSFGKGMKEFNLSLVEAQNEGSKAAQMFKALGVDIKAGPDVALRQFAEAISQLNDGELKVAATTEILKKSGSEWIPLLNGGAKALDESAEKARQLGLVIGTDFAQQAGQFNDNLNLLGRSSEALGIKLANPLIAALATLTTNFVEAKTKGNSLAQTLLEIGKMSAAFAANAPSIVPGSSILNYAGDKAATFLFGEEERQRTLRGGPDLWAIARRTMAGNPAAAPTGLPGAPNPVQVACVASGGKWVNGNCERVGAVAGRKENDGLADYARSLQMQQEILDEAERLGAKFTMDQQKKRDDEVEQLQRLRAQYVDLIDPLQKYRVQLDEVRMLREKGVLTADQAFEAEWKINEALDAAAKRMNDLADETKDANDWARDLGLTFTSAFEEAIAGGKQFSDVLRGIASDIAKLIVRKTITEPAGKALEEMVKGSDIGGFFSGLFGGGKAAGGAVMGGTAYLVGEQGPELFVPGASGAIVPNSAMGGGVTIHATYQIDSRTDRAAVIQAVEAGNRRLRAELETELAHGGAFRHAVGTA